MNIGILDFGNDNSMNGIDILNNIKKYCKYCDDFGFNRFWLTEHHTANIGWSNPEMLLPVIGDISSKIKIGLAGILASIHSPYRVAYSFRLLNSLFPGRIELGFANGRPDLAVARLLLNKKRITAKIYDEFDVNVKTICSLLRNDHENNISPFSNEFPNMWVLGSSYNKLPLALDLGIGFSRSLIHNNESIYNQIELLHGFKENFYIRHAKKAPATITISGLCHTSNKKARDDFYKKYKFQYDENSSFIVGCPEYFKYRMDQMTELTGVEEFVFCDMNTDNCRKYETLKELSRLL